MSWTFSSVCQSNLCVFAIVFQHGYGYCMRGPDEIQLYFHREYEHQGHCLTTHVALNTYWIQIIITVMMGTRYTGGGMRCCTKSKWLVLLGPKVSSSLTWSRALLMTQQVNIVVIEIISSTFDTNSLILVYAWG